MILNKNEDILIIIDMINGFVNEGAMANPNAYSIINTTQELVEQCLNDDVEIIHYIDTHQEDAQEFDSYPPHCLKGTSEAQPIKEIDYKKIKHIYKNSTNGFFAKNPFDYKKNIYIIGLVTDICIFEFALTAQKYKEEYNLPFSVNVINDLVTTFDAPGHNAKLVHKQFIDILESRGVNIIR